MHADRHAKFLSVCGFAVVDGVPVQVDTCETPESYAHRIEADARERAEALRTRRAARARTLRKLDVPVTAADERALIEETIDLDFGASIRAVTAWLANDNAAPWLVLCGPTGRGKTVAAAAALVEHGGVYRTASAVERLHASMYGEESDRYRATRKHRELWVLDELGTERSADTMTAALFDLVDARRGHCHRTIAIANLTQAAMQERYADTRLWSRLIQCAQWVADVGPDMRTQEGASCR
jgi:DNA replication protein DnaC